MHPFYFRIKLFLMASIILTSCRSYYMYSPYYFNKCNLDISPNTEWPKLEEKNHVIIHIGNEMKEIHSIEYGSMNQSIIAKSKPFEGEPLIHYNKLLEKPSKSARRNRKNANISDIKQIHVFLDSLTMIDSTKVSFLTNDINSLGKVNQDAIKNFYTSWFIFAGSICAIIGTIVLLDW